MKVATFKLIGVSAISFSRPFQSVKSEKESHEDFDNRCWRERCHSNGNGEVVIPASALKFCLNSIAKYRGVKIPGKGNKTWTKKFESGVLVLDNLELGIKLADVQPERIYVNADGIRGSSKRVWRTFPTIPTWECRVTVYIADEEITEDVFSSHLKQAGQFIGLGMYRPERGGFKGRFRIEDFVWADAA